MSIFKRLLLRALALITVAAASTETETSPLPFLDHVTEPEDADDYIPRISNLTVNQSPECSFSNALDMCTAIITSSIYVLKKLFASLDNTWISYYDPVQLQYKLVMCPTNLLPMDAFPNESWEECWAGNIMLKMERIDSMPSHELDRRVHTQKVGPKASYSEGAASEPTLEESLNDPNLLSYKGVDIATKQGKYLLTADEVFEAVYGVETNANMKVVDEATQTKTPYIAISNALRDDIAGLERIRLIAIHQFDEPVTSAIMRFAQDDLYVRDRSLQNPEKTDVYAPTDTLETRFVKDLLFKPNAPVTPPEYLSAFLREEDDFIARSRPIFLQLMIMLSVLNADQKGCLFTANPILSPIIRLRLESVFAECPYLRKIIVEHRVYSKFNKVVCDPRCLNSLEALSQVFTDVLDIEFLAQPDNVLSKLERDNSSADNTLRQGILCVDRTTDCSIKAVDYGGQWQSNSPLLLAREMNFSCSPFVYEEFIQRLESRSDLPPLQGIKWNDGVGPIRPRIGGIFGITMLDPSPDPGEISRYRQCPSPDFSDIPFEWRFEACPLINGSCG